MTTVKPKINVCLQQPPGYIHALALLEAADYVVAKAREAGYDAALSKNRILATGLNIVFGAHINPQNNTALPPNVVIFNTEQLPENSVWTNAAYKNVLQRHFVWDYSTVNLANIGHDRKELISFHHAAALDRIQPVTEPEFDLIFYGSVNDRRKVILDKLRATHGLKLATVFGLYGPERDELLRKSRALLNLHFYDSQIFQQIRAFYALSNGIPVISENFPRNSAPALYGDVVFTPGTEPFETYVVKLLGNREKFAAEAADKIRRFRAEEDRDGFRAALDRTVAAILDKNGIAAGAPSVPTRMNIGSGKDYRAGYLNVDINPGSNPDVVLDLAAAFELPVAATSPVYGEVSFAENSLDEIIAIDVLEHVPNLQQLMTNCLKLLKEGGRFDILVPYDLALGAWQDPTHVRAFNENSWLYYTEWFWYLGWFEYRFDVVSIDIIPSEAGKEMIKRNVAQQELLRTPRAIDSLKVILSKRKTTPEEKTSARAFSNNFRR